MIKMKGLGRGLDALLSGSDAKAEDELRNLPVERMKPGKYQPRTHMDQDSLAELAASIKAQGVMQPILVRAVDTTPGAERYEIVAGERRWRAAQLAGLTENFLSSFVPSPTSRRWLWRSSRTSSAKTSIRSKKLRAYSA